MYKKSNLILLILAQFLFLRHGHCAEYCVTNATELNAAITSAQSNSESDVIKLASGVYSGNFIFASTENSSITFDGGYNANCTAKNMSGETIIDAANTSSHALVISTPNIQNNINVSNIQFMSSKSYGIYVIGNGNITLDTVKSMSNRGGIFLTTLSGTNILSLKVKNSKISGNTGSGISIADSCGSVYVENTEISRNGSGLYMSGTGTSLNVVDSIVSWNSSDNSGGITLMQNVVNINIARNKIYNNHRGSSGGGIFSMTSTNLVIDNNEIYNNSMGRIDTYGPSGGGIEAYSDNVTISNNLIHDNVAATHDTYNAKGGGLRVRGAKTLKVVNNVLAKNKSGSDGSGAYVTCNGTTCDIVNNTIVGNASYHSNGGLFVEADSAVNIYNNILYDNTGNNNSKDLYIDNDPNGDYIETKSSILNNDIDPTGFKSKLPIVLDQSNVPSKPSFINPEANDYRLVFNSSVVNAGNNDAPNLPNLDKDGRPRVFQDAVDIGAYEWQGDLPSVANFTASVVRGKPPLVVQFTDTSTNSPSKWEWDFNGDGITDSFEPNPSFTFYNVGKQTVKLIVSNAGGRSEKVIADYIDVISNYPPFGSFWSDAISGRDGKAYATSQYVTLTGSIYVYYGQVSLMRFSNDCSNWTDWEAYAGRKDNWKLTDGDGDKIVCAQYKDSYDNVSQTFKLNIVLDRVVPDTYIISRPNEWDYRSEGFITFASTKDNSAFACSIDGVPIQTCLSPLYYFLPLGQHTFEVASIDAAYRKDPSPASITWTISNDFPLRLTFGGTGGGSVNGDMSCTSGTTCPSGQFYVGSTASLVATPNASSTFTGWSGACAGTGACDVVMSNAKSVTAIFTEAPKAKVGSKEFPTLQAAYNDASTTNGADIKLLEGKTGSLTANKSATVNIKGGYNAAYSSKSTLTTIHTPLIIRSGTVRVNGVAVQ